MLSRRVSEISALDFLSTVMPPRAYEAVALRNCGQLASKTLRNTYGVLRTMMRDAQIEEPIIPNPRRRMCHQALAGIAGSL